MRKIVLEDYGWRALLGTIAAPGVAIDPWPTACACRIHKAELGFPTTGAKAKIIGACSENHLCARQWFLEP